MKQILGGIRKAVQDFNMIQDGDKVAVGVSGGKDSMILLYGLKLFQNFSPVKYELSAITLNLGFDNYDLPKVENYFKTINVPYKIVDTQIAKIVFDIRKEKNPCSLCAKMRRGALHDAVKELGYNKVALGHHADDAIETLFLSMFYEGRIATFKPVTYLSRKNIHNIRPMVYLKEKQIISAVNRHDIPIAKSPCPMDKNTKREEVKHILNNIYKDIPDSRDRLLTSLMNGSNLSIWK